MKVTMEFDLTALDDEISKNVYDEANLDELCTLAYTIAYKMYKIENSNNSTKKAMDIINGYKEDILDSLLTKEEFEALREWRENNDKVN